MMQGFYSITAKNLALLSVKKLTKHCELGVYVFISRPYIFNAFFT
jgi:hypothetical protein